MPIGKFGDFPDTQKTCLFLRLPLSGYENGFLDHCVSAIFEFSRNEFELGENKLREKENQLSS
jgi:hypothetical protein